MIVTFALGSISVPSSVLTSQLSLAFKCVPKVTKVANCFPVGVVIADFKTMIYITRRSTVSLIKTQQTNFNKIKKTVRQQKNCFFF